MQTITVLLTSTGHAAARGRWRSPRDGYISQRDAWRWVGGLGWFATDDNRDLWDDLTDAGFQPLGYLGEFDELDVPDSIANRLPDSPKGTSPSGR